MPHPSVPTVQDSGNGHTSQQFWALALGTLGVVYGNIGTSPLYAFREAIAAAHAQGAGTFAAIVGILSLMTWTMLLIVTLKYVLVLLNADNNGEGGTFALMALGQSVARRSARVLLVLGIAGAAFLYGDAVITPAISVLSAVEGLKLIAPHMENVVVPITLLILVLLFTVQARGTAAVAQFFGPIMCIWFAVLAVGGLVNLADDPRVFMALNPLYGIEFVLNHGFIGLVVMGLLPRRYRCGGPLRGSWTFWAQAHPNDLAFSYSRHCSSTISGKAPYCLQLRKRSKTRSIACTPIGRSFRW